MGHRNEVNHVQFSGDGKYLVSGGDDGTVRLWNADTGVPIWNAVTLLSKPSRLYSHRGWATLTPTIRASARVTSKVEQAIETRGVMGRANLDTHTFCLLTKDRKLELWHTKSDEMVWQVDAPELTNLRPHKEGCLFTTPLGVQEVDGKARTKTFPNTENARSLSIQSNTIVVGLDASVLTFSDADHTRPTSTHKISTGISSAALHPVSKRLIVGFNDGSIESFPQQDALGDKSRLIDQKVSSPVTHLLIGEHDLLVVGYANGRVRLLNQSSGRVLTDVRLHGAIRFLRFEAGHLEAVSDLGQHRRWDISALELSPCSLAQNIRKHIPVQWVQGKPVSAPTPSEIPAPECDP